MKLGYPPGPGTVTQMVIGISESRGRALGAGGWGAGREEREQPCGWGRGGAGGALRLEIVGAIPNKMQGWLRGRCWDSAFLKNQYLLRIINEPRS